MCMCVFLDHDRNKKTQGHTVWQGDASHANIGLFLKEKQKLPWMGRAPMLCFPEAPLNRFWCFWKCISRICCLYMRMKRVNCCFSKCIHYLKVQKTGITVSCCLLVKLESVISSVFKNLHTYIHLFSVPLNLWQGCLGVPLVSPLDRSQSITDPTNRDRWQFTLTFTLVNKLKPPMLNQCTAQSTAPL